MEMAVMDPMTLSPERRRQYFWEGRLWEWNRAQSRIQKARGGYTRPHPVYKSQFIHTYMAKTMYIPSRLLAYLPFN
jgi:hypothetical protein